MLFIKDIIAPLCIVFGAALVYLIVSRIIKRIFKIKVKRVNDNKKCTFMTLILNVVRYVILIIAILLILEIYGIDTRAILASLGLVGLIIGLAFQDMIRDFIGGISIVIEGYYDVGDTITIGNFTGKVISLGMKTTRIEDSEGNIRMVTNGTIKDVTNHSIKDKK